MSRRLLVLVLCSTLAIAGGHPDFNGVWNLDLQASDSTEELLAAAGRSWAIRKLARTASVTQTITQTDAVLTLQVESAVASRKEVQLLDGSPTKGSGPDGGEVTARTRWRDDGQALVTTADVALPSGEKATFVVTRSLEEGGRTMRQRMELQTASGKTIAANRIFRRATP